MDVLQQCRVMRPLKHSLGIFLQNVEGNSCLSVLTKKEKKSLIMAARNSLHVNGDNVNKRDYVIGARLCPCCRRPDNRQLGKEELGVADKLYTYIPKRKDEKRERETYTEKKKLLSVSAVCEQNYTVMSVMIDEQEMRQ